MHVLHAIDAEMILLTNGLQFVYTMHFAYRRFGFTPVYIVHYVIHWLWTLLLFLSLINIVVMICDQSTMHEIYAIYGLKEEDNQSRRLVC